MILVTTGSLLVFLGITLGLAWPVASRLALDPLEKIVSSAMLSLLGIFFTGWILYVTELPNTFILILPIVALAGFALNFSGLNATLANEAVRVALTSYLLLGAWCLGWLALVVSYSGGGWTGDWYEHWERTRFFLERGPQDFRFLGHYSLAARPPLANVVVASFLDLTRANFAQYQLFTALFGIVSFLPAALLARRWGSDRAIRLLGLFVMLSPLFVQNVTFAWTKLPAAFFVLTALYFFLRARDPDAPRCAAPLFAASLAAGLLTHYSTGPYAVLLALAWMGLEIRRGVPAAAIRSTLVLALIGTAILATWFGWSIAAHGVRDTFLTNSSVTSHDVRGGNQLAKIALNVRDTLVPHFLRPIDSVLIAQTNPFGKWRDWFFQNYQLNFFFTLGALGWLVSLSRLRVMARSGEPRFFWAVFLSGVSFLGIAVHGQRDHWGLAHICLQPLAVLGLAFLAAQWSSLSRAWKAMLVCGVAVDFIFGIALHFGVQSFLLDRWFSKGRAIEEFAATYSESAQMNFAAKLAHRLEFFGDTLRLPAGVFLFILATVLAMALFNLRRRAESIER
jgi:4-amino-4-deoxy-L-arabinose transferase-like glycosyltransferase